MKIIESRRPLVATSLLLAALAAQAGVPTEEAAQLKSTLTPMGAEKAGNKDGSIPAWNGGMTTPFNGYKADGSPRPDAFANEKALYSITAKNMENYADKLTDGTKAMLKKYPDYRIDVFPSHRTAAAPQWVYENTFKNATRAKLVQGSAGPMPESAYGGPPFPIPKSGAEVIWNHALRWQGESVLFGDKGVLTTADGSKVIPSWINQQAQQYPYYYKEGNPESFKGEFALLQLINSGPPNRAGEGFTIRLNINDDKTQAWVYLPGQRRVRKLPNPCCDTPSPASAGTVMIDEIGVFSGRISRFDWKLIGKKEILVPYNTNKSMLAGDALYAGKNFMSPDHVRWELHRMWVVEATLAEGQRHPAVRSRYYIDEDSWTAILGDRWDAKGQLWHSLFALPILAPDLPGVETYTAGFYDLISGTWMLIGEIGDKAQLRPVARKPDSLFTPDGLVAEGVR
ncbi:MAG: uncharacterized protein H6R15_1018 [Proteobacteria bacterium]|nr:uncharacterized protein [Pseudomonadota bacterium]